MVKERGTGMMLWLCRRLACPRIDLFATATSERRWMLRPRTPRGRDFILPHTPLHLLQWFPRLMRELLTAFHPQFTKVTLEFFPHPHHHSQACYTLHQTSLSPHWMQKTQQILSDVYCVPQTFLAFAGKWLCNRRSLTPI